MPAVRSRMAGCRALPAGMTDGFGAGLHRLFVPHAGAIRQGAIAPYKKFRTNLSPPLKVHEKLAPSHDARVPVDELGQFGWLRVRAEYSCLLCAWPPHQPHARIPNRIRKIRFGMAVSWPGSHCSSLVDDVRKRIIWTASMPHVASDDVVTALDRGRGVPGLSARARKATASDPHIKKRRGRRVVRTSFNHPRTSPADPRFYSSEPGGLRRGSACELERPLTHSRTSCRMSCCTPSCTIAARRRL